ncbi:hypothetical protein EYF80_052104 [Liparis tanakae]|uniref:Uncharacterized protein n=1 Tax=Liparis tanakae TaxID=230148 RepID=A0A4Z2FAA2_9TELE|nr:hypothetical protein EYF80_052104 [Liparis tanakae]
MRKMRGVQDPGRSGLDPEVTTLLETHQETHHLSHPTRSIAPCRPGCRPAFTPRGAPRRTDDSRSRAKHRGGEDEGRQWTSCGEKGRGAAIKEERNSVGGGGGEEREHEERAMKSEDTDIKEKSWRRGAERWLRGCSRVREHKGGGGGERQEKGMNQKGWWNQASGGPRSRGQSGGGVAVPTAGTRLELNANDETPAIGALPSPPPR